MSFKVVIRILILAGLISFKGFSQVNSESNIQTYTPSKLLNKGSWDVKWFNNLYTQTKSADLNGNSTKVLRSNFFTSSLDIFTGITENNRINIGLLLEYRSNTIGGRSAFSVFDFGSEITARKGITSFAPVIKFQPFKSIGTFSIQSALHIPLVNNETENGVYLDQTAYAFQNRFFYDYTFLSKKWQVFVELNTEYNFGDENSFANNTFIIAPSIFMSYFPNKNITALGFLQHSERFGDFTQNYTALGFGGKYQLSKTLNLEVLYSNFVRGTDNGLGQTFNIGLRYLLTK